MSISIDTYCLQCLLRRNIALAQTLGTEEQAMAFAKEIMKLCINAPEGVSSPWFGPKIADLLHDMYGLDYDRFRQEKLDSNRFVLERLPAIREKVTNAKDPVFAGLQFAILGNYLDFSALQGQVSFEKLEEMLDKALEMELDDQVYACLCRDLRRGGKLVYLTDNAGEIGFDRVLAEAIAAAYPDISVTFCVRGAIAQNDATREDAAAVGILANSSRESPSSSIHASTGSLSSLISTAMLSDSALGVMPLRSMTVRSPSTASAHIRSQAASVVSLDRMSGS